MKALSLILLCATLLCMMCAAPAWAQNGALSQSVAPQQTAVPAVAPTTSAAAAVPPAAASAPTQSYDLAADAVIESLNVRYSDVRGTNFPNEFSAIGALAGFGCQMAVREGYIAHGVITAEKAFIPFKGADGQTFYFGSFLNAALLGNEKVHTSVWSLVASGAQQAGAKQLPDVQEIAAYNIKTAGTPAFGVPRLPAKYQPRVLPVEALKKTWPGVRKILTDNQVDPKYWGWTLALAAQKLILQNKSVFDPALAAQTIMEAAMPMSKIDPQMIRQVDDTPPPLRPVPDDN